ncbi:MAG: hypothetical protein DPW18_16770 [Chloroflexi bacterium]|nr:hypothetical protein [Chloroflexota bacterium]
MGGHLAGTEYLQRLISKFNIDCIEQTNFIKTNNMLKVPTYEQVCFGNCCQRNVQSVIIEVGSQNTPVLIFLSQSERIFANSQNFSVDGNQLGINTLHTYRGFFDLGGNNF